MGLNILPQKIKKHAIEGKTLYSSVYSVKQQDEKKQNIFYTHSIFPIHNKASMW